MGLCLGDIDANQSVAPMGFIGTQLSVSKPIESDPIDSSRADRRPPIGYCGGASSPETEPMKRGRSDSHHGTRRSRMLDCRNEKHAESAPGQKVNSAGLPHDGFWDQPLDDLERLLEAAPGGLTSTEAAERRARFGASVLAPGSRLASIADWR